MPLIHSKSDSAFKQNVKTLTGEVGQSPHVQSQKQALAIAFSEKRRARAEGGPVFQGPIVSAVPGRTDDHPMDVASGSYVLPAEFVSHMGENNTLAGLDKIKKIGAHGLKRMAMSCGGYVGKASGGPAGGQTSGEAIPINAAGGEFVVPPDWVHHIGDGDMKRGHRLLDNLVMKRRQSHLKTLKALKPPAQD